MLEDFKKFAMRGNALDLAVGVIIGAAFSKIVSSLVDDMIMPIIGAITPGGLDFSNYYIALSSRNSPITRPMPTPRRSARPSAMAPSLPRR